MDCHKSNAIRKLSSIGRQVIQVFHFFLKFSTEALVILPLAAGSEQFAV